MIFLEKYVSSFEKRKLINTKKIYKKWFIRARNVG